MYGYTYTYTYVFMHTSYTHTHPLFICIERDVYVLCMYYMLDILFILCICIKQCTKHVDRMPSKTDESSSAMLISGLTFARHDPFYRVHWLENRNYHKSRRSRWHISAHPRWGHSRPGTRGFPSRPSPNS